MLAAGRRFYVPYIVGAVVLITALLFFFDFLKISYNSSPQTIQLQCPPPPPPPALPPQVDSSRLECVDAAREYIIQSNKFDPAVKGTLL